MRMGRLFSAGAGSSVNFVLLAIPPVAMFHTGLSATSSGTLAVAPSYLPAGL